MLCCKIFPNFVPAVQHERGPRKPKMQSQMGPGGGHHHHHHHHHHPSSPHHLPVSLVTSVSASFNYTSHLAAANNHHHHNFHPSSTLHHPQPLPFNPIAHPVHHHPPLVQTTKLEPNKMSAFDYPSSNSDHFKSVKHLSPSPTQTIKSSSSIEPMSEGLASPQSSPENQSNGIVPGANVILNNNNNNNVNNNTNRSNQNGLLEILMSPDKCHEFLQYQVHNSIIFSPITHNPLDVNLPSWEVLQVN